MLFSCFLWLLFFAGRKRTSTDAVTDRRAVGSDHFPQPAHRTPLLGPPQPTSSLGRPRSKPAVAGQTPLAGCRCGPRHNRLRTVMDRCSMARKTLEAYWHSTNCFI